MATQRWTWIFLTLAIVALTPAAGAKDKKKHVEKSPTVPKLREPQHLPAAARLILVRRMERHGVDMTQLLWSVLMLNYDEVQKSADQIASEPRLARPLPGGSSELNALLPPRFFELQDQLYATAKGVSEAAQARNDGRIAKAFGNLSQTCIQCHGLYLNEPVKTAQ